MDLMMMAASQALGQLMSPYHFGFLLVGVGIGLVVGFLPGLGGIVGLSLVLPLLYGMEPTMALAMMIGIVAPLTTSDVFTAVLMGIPGTSASQATVMDGFPLAKQGQASRALSAAFISSLLGGLIGAFVLTGSVLVARPLILMLGFSELMMIVVFSLTMVGMLSGGSALKGLAACGLGLLLGTIGSAPATGEYRLTFGTLYLLDGVSIVIVGLGMFAIPEIVDLLRKHDTISSSGKLLGNGWLQGIRDVIRHKWIVVRCSAIGCMIGALPGLGGSVVDWIAYGHVIQTSRDRSQFGKGDIRGVIGPESAANAVQGGALFPTLFFGIPGSGTMAMLLAAFMLIGIQPGIGMMERNLDLTFTVIWSLALANVFGAAVCFLLAGQIAKITTIRYQLVAPVMIVIIFFAAYQSTRSWNDFGALLALGALGILMKRFGWSRPALLIGFVLSTGLERSVYQTVQIYGITFFERPIVIVLMVMIALSIGFSIWAARSAKLDLEVTQRAMAVRLPQVAFSLAVLAAAAAVLFVMTGLSWLGRVFPMTVAGLTLAMVAAVVVQQIMRRQPAAVFTDDETLSPGTVGVIPYLLWMASLLPLVYLFGLPVGSGIFVAVFVWRLAKMSPPRAFLMGACVTGLFFMLSNFLQLYYPGGYLVRLAGF